MAKRFFCQFCPMEFSEQIRLERHAEKAHEKKEDYMYRDHLWYTAGATSGYV